MADPFSVVGSAVGVVSLGIEVCKGLVWYIDNAKNAKDRISQLSDQTDRLTCLLELLESVLEKTHAGRSRTETKAGVLACSEALDNIRTKLRSATPAGGSKFGQQLRSLKQQLLFPIKQSDLQHCKNVVESVQGNLNTALIVLQL